jgi:membrane protein DedA with SNARE-associated domain
MAGANRMPQPQFLLANLVGASVWATFFGVAAYALGRQVERLAGWGVVVLVIATVIVLIVAAIFVRGHEEQLEAEAERALPGPLQSP